MRYRLTSRRRIISGLIILTTPLLRLIRTQTAKTSDLVQISRRLQVISDMKRTYPHERVFTRANSLRGARRDHSTRISTMKCVYRIHTKSTFLPLWERLVFIRWGESSFFCAIRWRNPRLKSPSACATTDQTSLVNTMRQLTSFSRLPSRFRIPQFHHNLVNSMNDIQKVHSWILQVCCMKARGREGERMRQREWLLTILLRITSFNKVT